MERPVEVADTLRKNMLPESEMVGRGKVATNTEIANQGKGTPMKDIAGVQAVGIRGDAVVRQAPVRDAFRRDAETTCQGITVLVLLTLVESLELYL